MSSNIGGIIILGQSLAYLSFILVQKWDIFLAFQPQLKSVEALNFLSDDYATYPENTGYIWF